jgi:AAA15 family ATPase/GTPase
LKNSKSSQILFTTHNQALLELGLLRDDEIWFVEKGEDGGSNYRNLSKYTGIRKGTSRKNLYQAGKLGAKPIMGDYTKL